MTPRLRRAVWIAAVVASMSVATALVANAFRSNIVFFYSPSQVMAKESPAGRSFRLGGVVERGSLRREGLSVRFAVSDTVRHVPVRYEGILPDLFKEGKGVVAQGMLDAHGVFVAREVLAKHDENYMPPEAGAALARARAGQMPVEIAVERAK